MVSRDDVTISLLLDNTQALAAIDQTEEQMDRVVDKWALTRQNIEKEIRATMRNITSLISTFRGVMSAMGATIDPWFDALLAMVSSAISTLFAVGVAMTESIVGSPFALAIFTAAIGLQAFTTGKLLREFGEITGKMLNIEIRLGTLQENRNPLGGSF
jgi:hypothetical protein